mmetsp:Transcript_1655/g.3559  ORF Transcript_1655/g.3559 Transcript_1655/m.3559 type:complete len:93 (+) Transcript_1655:567-845(+)
MGMRLNWVGWCRGWQGLPSTLPRKIATWRAALNLRMGQARSAKKKGAVTVTNLGPYLSTSYTTKPPTTDSSPILGGTLTASAHLHDPKPISL